MSQTSGSRAVDFLITYRVIRLLVTPWTSFDAYKLGIIDDNGKILKKYKTLKDSKEKKAYTLLHRFIFNLKRILQKVGLGSRLGSFAVALALLIKENKELEKHKTLIESAVISYLKETKQYNEILNESKDIIEINDTPYINCFGVDVYEVNGELVSEFDYAKYKV
jgi:hypothetical protein